MAFPIAEHTAHIYDRGGKRYMGALPNIISVAWERIRDETSTASVQVGAKRSQKENALLGLLAAGRHELVIYRGYQRVWEGPITLLKYEGNSVEIGARDITHYLNRLNITREYDNRYPNVRTVIEHTERVLTRELVRLEAQVPPNNVLPNVVYHHHWQDAGTSSRILPFQYNVYENIDNMAMRSGMDFTVIGRDLHIWDVHRAVMGQTVVLDHSDFIGDVVITEYGMEMASIAAVTDGKGRAGVIGAPDPFYGIVERLDTAYDEDTGEEWDEGGGNIEPPSIADLRSQAQRLLAGSIPTPIAVRVPDNSSLNPNGKLVIHELVPGIRIPLRAEVPGRLISQLQMLDRVSVTEDERGENIAVTMSPAPNGNRAAPLYPNS